MLSRPTRVCSAVRSTPMNSSPILLDLGQSCKRCKPNLMLLQLHPLGACITNTGAHLGKARSSEKERSAIQHALPPTLVHSFSRPRESG
jgi:hypothetical protein